MNKTYRLKKQIVVPEGSCSIGTIAKWNGGNYFLPFENKNDGYYVSKEMVEESDFFEEVTSPVSAGGEKVEVYGIYVPSTVPTIPEIYHYDKNTCWYCFGSNVALDFGRFDAVKKAIEGVLNVETEMSEGLMGMLKLKTMQWDKQVKDAKIYSQEELDKAVLDGRKEVDDMLGEAVSMLKTFILFSNRMNVAHHTRVQSQELIDRYEASSLQPSPEPEKKDDKILIPKSVGALQRITEDRNKEVMGDLLSSSPTPSTGVVDEKGLEIVEYWNVDGHHKPSDYCKKNGCKITSVKRLKDGDVFSVGNEIIYCGLRNNITGFELYTGAMCAKITPIDSEVNAIAPICDIKHAKPLTKQSTKEGGEDEPLIT